MSGFPKVAVASNPALQYNDLLGWTYDPEMASATTVAPSARRSRQTEMAAVSRVSLVSFLKAKPSTAMRLPLTVLNKSWTIRAANRFFCQSFMRTTLSQ